MSVPSRPQRDEPPLRRGQFLRPGAATVGGASVLRQVPAAAFASTIRRAAHRTPRPADVGACVTGVTS